MCVTLQNHLDAKVEGNFIIYVGNVLAANVSITIALIAMIVYFVRHKTLLRIIVLLNGCDEKVELCQNIPNN
jgi:hypothetical protein